MNNNKQKSMSWFAFQIMRLVMNIRKKYRNLEEETNFIDIKVGDYVLDFGCGLGFNTIPAAKIVGEQGVVFALDLSKQSIKIIENKIRKNNFDNIKVILSDCDTGLKNESIDLVLLHNTLPLIKEKQKVLNEITRILKIGGRLSYMSRIGSKIYGKDNITDTKLKEILKFNFKLITERKGHLIFERTN